jgi:S-(hydroxymethyl)mycothiol dehydrogenase
VRDRSRRVIARATVQTECEGTAIPHEVRGVIARSRGAPVEVVTVHVPDPGPEEVVIRVEACGVCHTDLHYREGGIGDAFPFLLGHEAAGSVEAVGAGVTNVAPGDVVVVAWRAPCGTCRSCLRGRPWYCFDSQNARQRMTLDDGTELTAALGIGAFAEFCLVHARQAVKVDPSVRREAAALIGCGVMAGFGAAVTTGAVAPGDTVAVIGCGGVGNAAISGASIAGARMVIGIDVVERKLEWARRFGATHTIDATRQDPVEAIRALTGGFGADLVVDAVGRPETYLQAFLARDHAGRLVNVGVPPEQGMSVELPMSEVFGRGGSLRSSWYGDCLPTRDFPVLIDLYRKGRLDLDGFVSEIITVNDVEDAFSKIMKSEVLRSVVVFTPR